MLRLLRHAFRQIRRSPGFAITAILTLTLGVGASTAIFAILDAVLLDPLPFPQPDRLVAVWAQPDPWVSIPTMLDYRSRSTAFTSLAAYRSWSPAQKPGVAPPARRILAVSQRFFSTLGVGFALGTSWPVTGNERDCTGHAIVSNAYWNRLGGGSTLGGRKLNLGGRDFEIAAVLPAAQAIEGSYELNRPEVFVPVGCDTDERVDERGDMSFSLLGRMRPGVSLAQANADLARVDQTLVKDYPNDYASSSAAFRKAPLVFPYIELLIGAQTKPALTLTFAACGLLLLIACTNLASLLLARNTRRRAEFATRATLGASLTQLLRQLMVENSVLVALGAGGGIALAVLLLKLVESSTAFHLPRLENASLNPAVLCFTILVSVAVTCLLTLLPALRTLRPGLLRDMQGAGRTSASRSLRVAGRLLVVAQVTFALVLVACAGWMVGGVYLLLHQPLGFAPGRLLMVRVFAADSAGRSQGSQAELALEQVAAGLGRLPGVVSVAVTDHPPLGHAVNRYDFCSDAHPGQCDRQVTINPNSYAITPGYFATVGQPLLEGREFNSGDDGGSHVAIVNQALAAREWPGQSAIGRRVHTGEIHLAKGVSWATVVGVAGNVHSYDLESAPGPDIYLPRAENPSGFATILLNASGNPAAFIAPVRTMLRHDFPQAKLAYAETFAEEMSSEVSERAFLMQVALSFGGVALFLSILGVYGVFAYEVSLRAREIGIRLALGSSRQRVVTLLLQQEGLWLTAGTLLGLGCAATAGYALRARFYGTHSTSPIVLLGSAALLLAPTLFAIALPARRAALQDPAHTLRSE